jgi:exopolysaccharide biosynthesis WecB/TagA/CpsF family protein
MEKVKLVKYNGLNLISCTFNDAAGIILSGTKNEQDKFEKLPSVYFHINVYNYFILKKILKINLSASLEGMNFFFDGIGMKLSAFISGKGWHHDLNGTDLFPLVMDKMNKDNFKLYFLGTEEDVITSAIENILIKYPNIEISGYHSGFFDLHEEKEIIEDINHSGSDILIVGRGFATEFDFISRNYNKIRTSIVWNVGGLFDFISGKKPRAPLFLRKLRLEWFFRFILEPKRMFFRSFILLPWFFCETLKLCFKRKSIIQNFN